MSTIAELIGRYLKEKSRVGKGAVYRYQRIQSEPFAQKNAAKLTAGDWLEFARARKAGGVLPCTVLMDVTSLRVMLRYASDVWDEQVNLAAWDKAKRHLEAEQLIGKSQPRDRRPTADELDRLLAYFAERDARSPVIKMVPVARFQIASARRISETCRIERQHVDTETWTCVIHNLKNPKGKGYSGRFALLGDAKAVVQERLAVIPHEPHARIFPYNPRVISQAYVEAKHALHIDGLHLHDSRREACSRLFEKGFSVPEVQSVSLHANPTMLLKVYTRIDPSSLHNGPAAKR